MGVVCKNFPYWGWVAEAGGAEVMWVASSEEQKSEAAFGSADRTGVAWWDRKEELKEWITRQAAVGVVCFDSVKPRSLPFIWGLSGVELVIWFGQYPRGKLPIGWTRTSITLEHAALGGVTNGSFAIHVATRNGAPRFTPQEVVGVRMYLYSIVDRTESGRPCAPVEDGKTQLVNLKESSSERYVVPSVFSSTGFVRRKLSTKELALVWDLPAGVLKVCASSQVQDRMVQAVGIPFKLRVHVLSSLRRVSDEPCVEMLTMGAQPSDPRLSSVQTKQRSQQDAGGGAGASTVEERVKLEANRDAKATKADDAEVPRFLWNDRLRLKEETSEGEMARVEEVLERFRSRLHRRWISNVARSFWRWVIEEKDANQGVDTQAYAAGLAAIGHALESDWWEWKGGSATFFWRWPPAFRDTIQNGLPPRFIGPPPSNKKPQRVPLDDGERQLLVGKVNKLRARKYIAPGPVLSLINMFPVPKGDSDIRLVFDATASGLNEVLYAPWFALPTVAQMVRTVDKDYFCADNDFGEMFYNFWLHKDLRAYTGIDLTRLCPNEKGRNATLWEHFTRPTMGLGPSPYQAMQGALQFKSLVIGRGTKLASEPTEVFHWVKVTLNIPGTTSYNPGKPWIYKERADGQIAADMHLFVDNSRTTAPTLELAWQGGSRIAKLASWYGLQDAARKRRPPSQTPGAWSGAVVATSHEGVFLSVSVERWAKTKASVRWVADQVNNGASGIEFKPLERIRGFLVYVGQTYRALVPYLKGIHLTLDSWRSNRDDEGWRLARASREDSALEESPEGSAEKAPDHVAVVPRLSADVEALLELVNAETPPQVGVRPSVAARVVIGFGDASGNGFGISEADNKDGYEAVKYAYGVWEESVSQESSNFRELNNFVVRVESGLKNGDISAGTEFFLFTDNFVTERAFYKGTSKAKVLFDLVL